METDVVQKRKRCGTVNKYKAIKSPTCGCEACDMRWQLKSQYKTLHDRVWKRIEELDLTEDDSEIQTLLTLLGEAKRGIRSLVLADAFLSKVPAGSYKSAESKAEVFATVNNSCNLTL